MFTAWLMEELGRDDSVGLFAKCAYDEINNGCASPYRHATEWKRHFEERHPRQLPKLMGPLGDAYVEFCTSFDKNKMPF